MQTNKTAMLEHLKTNILQVVAEITPETYEKVIENYLELINCCRMSKGGNLPETMFHN